MTTLYRPVQIETAEQAEALPDGAIATHDDHMPVEKFQSVWQSRSTSWDARDLIGWTALVPIEAEEEWKTLHEGSWHLKADEDEARRDTNARGTRHRYTTDWEEA